MNTMQLIPPCARCPYKRGLIKTTVNPCPQCKASGYKLIKELSNRLSAAKPDKKNR